ncbi:hypothetical protein BS47DRAFT_1482065 [Hydnum rufescens UP504]|uniref:SH3 domain-containing protein n=1 Tax=Hydnum rufescens UP504 TaxID=1448309 RepID=A0A9P6B8T4_9AGAM|nr:hypothetical protein BS47DRAFT_1482065 [Hydnum rufescens UP504]
MTARRQPSTTSLARYVRDSEPAGLSPNSMDFCNSFWGLGDVGVDVLFARMRGAGRTMEEIRGFWRERAAIEDDYAKRLAKLSKLTLGRDEIGELRNSLDTLRLETERQAAAHLGLAQSMRRELEAPATEHIASRFSIRRPPKLQSRRHSERNKPKRTSLKRCRQLPLRFYTVQHLILSVVSLQAREKYKTDCVNINLYHAQTKLVQGRDLEKIQMRLEKAKQTVQQNERDYSNSVDVLRDTCYKWEADWKVFCDQCQDLEDERIEFMKDIMWAYANAVSTVCVADDESCEKVRVTLEQLEPERDMENFVREYGTGPSIPEPPRFHSFEKSGDTQPRPQTRPSAFSRSSSRPNLPRSGTLVTSPVQIEEELPATNVAGLGAGTRNGGESTGPNGFTRVPNAGGQSNGSPSANLGQPPTVSVPQSYNVQAAASNALPARGGAPPRSQLKVGPNLYNVDPTKDPQPGSRPNLALPISSQTSAGVVGDPGDPIARALEELKKNPPKTQRQRSIRGQGGISAAAASNAAVARSTTPSGTVNRAAGVSATGPSRSLSRSPSRKPIPVAEEERIVPSSSPPRQLDLQGAADSLVGAHPSSRPSSPIGPAASTPPKPVFMQSPRPSASPAPVVESYGQALPGERRLSRANLNAPSTGAPTATGGGSRPGTPSTSPVPFAGIGANGRSPSPQPAGPLSRAPSPSGRPPSRAAGPPLVTPGQDPRQLQRVPSPSIGIALDSSGQVAHDEVADNYVADDYARRSGQQRSAQTPQQQGRGPSQPQRQSPPVQQQYQNLGQQQQAPQQMYTGLPAQRPDQGDNRMQGSTLHRATPIGTGPQQPLQQQAVGYPQNGRRGPSPQESQSPITQQAPQQLYSNSGYSQQGYGPPLAQQAPMNGGYAGQPVQPQQPMSAAGYRQQGPTRSQTISPVYGYNQPIQPQQPPVQQPPPVQYGYQNVGYAQLQQPVQSNVMAPPQQVMTRSPSPMVPPTSSQGNQVGTEYLEDGTPILFYVKALYDYNATIDEEFDFQTGDIIAVTATPEDGWWSGVLLDDARRVPGRTVFPSNFVCLF